MTTTDAAAARTRAGALVQKWEGRCFPGRPDHIAVGACMILRDMIVDLLDTQRTTDAATITTLREQLAAVEAQYGALVDEQTPREQAREQERLNDAATIARLSEVEKAARELIAVGRPYAGTNFAEWARRYQRLHNVLMPPAASEEPHGR